jgi:hypothetical protein
MMRWTALSAFIVLGIADSSVAGGQGRPSKVTLTYLGTAGWEITDGKSVILIDPIFHAFPYSRALRR